MTADAVDAYDRRTRAQVWVAIRRLSDDELERVQHLLLVSRSVAPGDGDDTPAVVRIPLTLIEDAEKEEHNTNLDNQADNDVLTKSTTMAMRSRTTQWTPSDLIHVFLSELHHAVHSQQAISDAATSPSAISAADANSSANAATTKDNGSNVKTLRIAKPTKSSGTSQQSPFALQSDDFPSLIRGSAPAKTTSSTSLAVQRPAVKAAKRRITTTLVSDQNAITRPVLNPVAFPPLGGSDPAAQSSNPWAKRELLERRMVPSAEGADGFGSALESTPPSKPWGQQHLRNKSTETRISSAAKIPIQQPFFDDSPPGGPKRVQPFPVAAAQRPVPADNVAAECHSPMVTPVKNAAKLPPMPLCVKQKRPRRQALLPSTTESSPALLQEPSPRLRLQDENKCADDFQINAQAAKLYGFLIRKRFVGSTYTELQLLISLLFRSDCAGSSSSDESSPASVSTCGFTNEFCWRSRCLSFAALVFNGIEATLTSLGVDLLRLLMRSLADADICAEMLARLQEFAQRREELRIKESARIGCKLPIETKASAVRDFALPFCEEIDSRLHYRSPTESVMYSNREKIRDGFLNLLRQFQIQQHSLVGIESASVAAAAIENAKKLFGDVAPENRWWFAKFFVMELLQVGSNLFGESDKDLVLKIMEDKLVVKNPDRLRKLHRRFTSQKQSNKAPTSSNGNQGPSGSSTASNHFGSSVAPSKPSGGSNTTNSWKSDRPESRGTGGPAAGSAANGAITTTFENTRQHFAENQQFFFHFLHSCDSYEFSQLVKYQLEFQFQSIWKETVNADPRKTFTEMVLKLKVVAKFLGYLRFSPQWHNSSSLAQLSKQNPAFKAAEKEAVGTLENTSDTLGLDVKLLLEQSVFESTISKCVPWLCDYLTMLSLDKLSTATSYFKQLLVLLELIYHSSRLDSLGETGLYIAMQIERVFHVLELDIAGFMDDAEFRSPSLLPSSRLLLTLEQAEPSVVQSGEDNLPFLYSQVFVQSCVNELEDLRGFIQTRAKPSHRVTKRAAAGGASLSGANQLTAIRKLRPLQVITEDEHSDTTADATMASTATSLTDDDRLSESIFKIHPNLKKVVEFVVEVVATNICEHVLQQVVIPSANTFVNSCVQDSGLASPRRSSLSSSSVTSTMELEATTLVFLQLVESRVFRTIQETVVRSLQETTRLCNDQVRASIPPLLPPSCHPTLAQSVLLVALNRTRGVTNNLIPKSCRSEFTKRLTLRKKAILKETASKSAAAAASARDQEPTSSGDEDDTSNVVRTLSSMFDEHAGVEDSREEELFALKHASAQIFKLSRSRGTGSGEHASSLAMEDWTKVHVSVTRHLKTFASRLRALQCADERSEQNHGYDLVVWDATWRVTTSCLRVLARFSDVVVGAEWKDNERTHAATTQALEGSVSGFIDAFIALLLGIAAGSSSKERAAHTEDATARRIRTLVEAVVDSLVAKPRRLEALEARACASAALERLVVSPRARILTAFMAAGDAEAALLTTQRSCLQHEPHHESDATKSLCDAQQFRSEVWRRTTARHS